MDDAAIVSGLMPGDPGLLFQDSDTNTVLFADYLESGGKADDTATDNNNLKAQIHGVSLPQSGFLG
jgi:hypothetical protein